MVALALGVPPCGGVEGEEREKATVHSWAARAPKIQRARDERKPLALVGPWLQLAEAWWCRAGDVARGTACAPGD